MDEKPEVETKEWLNNCRTRHRAAGGRLAYWEVAVIITMAQQYLALVEYLKDKLDFQSIEK